MLFLLQRVGLDLFASGAKISQDLVNPVLINITQASAGYFQLDPAILTLHPEAVSVQIWQKAPTRSVFRVRNVVSSDRTLSGYLTDLGHDPISR